MLHKSRLGHVGAQSSFRRFIQTKKSMSFWITSLLCLLIMLYYLFKPDSTEIPASVISNESPTEIQAKARAYFDRLGVERRTRDNEEYALQREILTRYKAQEALTQREIARNTQSSLLSLYTPTPKLVPAHLDVLDLSHRGVCIQKEACQKCPKDGGQECTSTGYRAVFACPAAAHTDLAASDAAGPVSVGAVEPPTDVFVPCEHAYVDGRQAFWAIMAVCAGGAVLAGACYRTRLRRMFV